MEKAFSTKLGVVVAAALMLGFVGDCVAMRRMKGQNKRYGDYSKSSRNSHKFLHQMKKAEQKRVRRNEQKRAKYEVKKLEKAVLAIAAQNPNIGEALRKNPALLSKACHVSLAVAKDFAKRAAEGAVKVGMTAVAGAPFYLANKILSEVLRKMGVAAEECELWSQKDYCVFDGLNCLAKQYICKNRGGKFDVNYWSLEFEQFYERECPAWCPPSGKMEIYPPEYFVAMVNAATEGLGLDGSNDNSLFNLSITANQALTASVLAAVVVVVTVGVLTCCYLKKGKKNRKRNPVVNEVEEEESGYSKPTGGGSSSQTTDSSDTTSAETDESSSGSDV